MSSTNTSVGTDTILVTHQRAICYAAFSATGKTITSFASIGSEIESKVRAAATYICRYSFRIAVYPVRTSSIK